MRRDPAVAVLLWMTLAQAGATLDQQGLGGLAPFFTQGLGLDHAGLGVVYGGIYLGSALFTAPSGILVDRFGERAVVLTSGLLMGLAVALGALVRSEAWLVGTLFVFGVGYAASSPAGGRAVLSWFTRNRALAMGIRQAGAPIGGTLGALLLPAVALHGGYRPALVVGGVACAASAVLATWRYRPPNVERGTVRRSRELLRGMWRFVVAPRSAALNAAGFALGAAQYTAVAFIVVALLHDGAPRALAALSLAIMQGAGIAARPLWGIASDALFRGSRIVPLLLTCGLAALSLWWLGAVDGPPSVLTVVGISTGLGCSVIGFTGLFNTVLAELGGIDAAGSAMGVGLSFVYLAGFAAPIAFGALVDAHGFGLAWKACAVFVALAAPLLLAARERTTA
ncbi:MAG TPA: MFS transporter [Candidatus Sulfotelmatobacter sp.]|nr:MFS transporter [Candidatus Sulfotelmatobacter sp.]